MWADAKTNGIFVRDAFGFLSAGDLIQHYCFYDDATTVMIIILTMTMMTMLSS